MTLAGLSASYLRARALQTLLSIGLLELGVGMIVAAVLVFIGKKLPKDLFIAGLEECLAK